MKNNKRSGHDSITAILIKDLKEQLAHPISNMINKSLSEVVVPNLLRAAKVTPIAKDEKGNELISVLPTRSKIFDNVIFKRLYSYLDQNAIVHETKRVNI